MYTRPEFTKKVGCNYSELRYYERRGLLLPDDVNAKTKRHYYSENAVKVYFYIQKLQKIGYSLDEIQAHLQGTDGLTDEAFYAKREQMLKEQLTYLDEIKKEQPVHVEESKKWYNRPVAKKMKE